MNKKFISIIVFFILLVIFMDVFSSSYTSHNLGNLAYVLALGIDVGENAKMKISAQFSRNTVFSSDSSSSGGDSNPIVLISAEADSIFSGLNLLNSYIGKELNLAQCSVIVFSEEFAQNGIGTEILTLINNEEVRPSTNLVVSKCDAYDYLNNVEPNLEKLTTKYFETFSITSRFTGYISNITVGEFFNNFSSETCDAVAILGGLNATAREESSEDKNNESSSSSDSSSSGSSNTISSNTSEQNKNTTQNSNVITNPEDLTANHSSVVGKRGTENIGIAVFDEDKFCGELTATESICHLLISNKVDSCVISVNNPTTSSSEKIELQLYPNKKTKVSVNIIDNVPHISINIFVVADILTIEHDVDYEIEENLEKVSNSAEDYLKSELNKYLQKVSREYGTDIDHFSTKAFPHFSTVNELKDFNWSEKFKKAKFDVNVDVDVTSSLLVTKT